MPMRNEISLLSALALAAAPALVRQAETDVVVLRDGASVTGKVLEESLDGLTLQPESGPKSVVAWTDVASVEYADAPDELTAGLATLGSGNLELAGEQLRAVLALEDLRPMIRQQALFHVAALRRHAGDEPGALELLTQLLSDFPRGRFLRAAAESAIELRMAAGDEAAARAVLDGVARGLEGHAAAPAITGLLEGRLLVLAGKTDEAGQRFAAVEGLAGVDPLLADEARLGRGSMLLASGKGAEAEPILRALVTNSASSRVQAGAWNALGDMQSTDGRARKDAERILDALYAYLRTIVQYRPLPGESTAEYERALAGSATCFQYLSELEQNPEKKRLYRERNRERLDRLQREFPSSRFLKKT